METRNVAWFALSETLWGRRPVERFEGRYALEDGNSLDLAESELACSPPNVLSAVPPNRRWLIRALPGRVLGKAAKAGADYWRFTTADARSSRAYILQVERIALWPSP